MLFDLAKRWWVLLLRGLFAIAFGILAFLWPGLTLAALVIVYGIYAMVDGITAIWFGLAGGRGRPWWAMLLVGILGVAAGVVTFLWPQITAVALLAVIAAWAIIRGIFEISAAIRLRRVIDNEWLLALGGALSIAFGVLLAVQPAAGALAVVWIIGAYAIAFGVIAVALSLRLRWYRKRIEEGHTGGPNVALR